MADTPNPYPHNTGAYPAMPVNQGNTSQAFAIPMGYMPAPPPPPTPPSVLAVWWKQLAAFCAGLTAFGVVAYAVASKFFLPREDFSVFSDSLKKVESNLENVQTSVGALKESVQASTQAVQRFDRIIAAEGLSEDAAVERRKKKPNRAKPGLEPLE